MIISLLFCLFLSSCKQADIYLNEEESFYSNFKVENDKVYIYCNVLIENPKKDNAQITLEGTFGNDVKNGLLKEATLQGYSIDCETSTFELVKGDNIIEVVFIGEYGGNYQKHDKLLPQINIKELA